MSDERAWTMGDELAWVTTTYGRTSGLSAIHRYFEQGETFCRHPVPPEKRLLDLTLVRVALHRCSRCNELAARAMKRDTEPARSFA